MEAVELGNVMEAARATDSVEATAEVADTVETAVGVAGIVDAAMEGVTAGMPPRAVAMVGARAAATTAAVRVAASAVFRSMDLSPLQAVHPRQCYRRRLTPR
jgi:hypothetical protein